jgi:hypothetical protein
MRGRSIMLAHTKERKWIKITDVSEDDAYYDLRDELIGRTGIFMPFSEELNGVGTLLLDEPFRGGRVLKLYRFGFERLTVQ